MFTDFALVKFLKLEHSNNKLMKKPIPEKKRIPDVWNTTNNKEITWISKRGLVNNLAIILYC